MDPNNRLMHVSDTFPAIRTTALIGIFSSILAAAGIMHLEMTGLFLMALGLIFAQILMPPTEAPGETGHGESTPDPSHHSPRPGCGRACPKCGWRDVRRSMPQGVLDTVIRVAGLVPYRCRTCGARFYRGRTAH
ncbi:MAG: hypothetical protein U0Q18_25940 [Bryobacteraceae bacterium]